MRFDKTTYNSRKSILNLLILISICCSCSGALASQDQLNGPSINSIVNYDIFNYTIIPSINYNPVEGIEKLLRDQAILTVTFEDLLHQTPTTIMEKITFLNSFEDLIRRQSILLSEFDNILKIDWYKLDNNQQTVFLSSFEDLIWRESGLLGGFYNLSQQDWSEFDSKNQTSLLSKYEELLRMQSDLINSYKDLYRKSNGGISIELTANRTTAHYGDTVRYTYIIANWYSNRSLKDVYILDNVFGSVVSNVTLEPMETKYFSKFMVVTGDTYNRARVVGKDFMGNVVTDESNSIFVRVIKVGRNFDSMKVGNQVSRTFGSEFHSSSNDLEIKKNQQISNNGSREMYNDEQIEIGDQVADSFASGGSNNRIKIEANQS